MVCDGPDPPENNPHELTPPSRHELVLNGNHGDDSDEEHENFGYQQLPQRPLNNPSDDNSDEESEVENSGFSNTDDVLSAPNSDVPLIEPMETTLTREVWSMPRSTDPIQMDSERVQQVMSAMANFALPQASIPEWAQNITEEQWKLSLQDKIETMKGNR